MPGRRRKDGADDEGVRHEAVGAIHKPGADVVLDFMEQDPVKTILEPTDGQGVDSAIEGLGAQATFEACVKVTRPGGPISNIGYHGQGDYVQLPRLDWGVGVADKTIRTGLCLGGRGAHGAPDAVARERPR